MIIDAHAHVFAFPKLKPSIDETVAMSAENQIELMDKKGIDKAIILPLNNAESPHEKQSIGEICYICEKYPGRFIPFCNFDPRLPKHPDLITVDDYLFLLNQYKQLGCKGIGEVTARIPFDDPLMLMLFEACEKVGFPVTFHIITSDVNSYGLIDEIGLPRVEKVLGKYPNLKFFGHSQAFWSEIGGEITLAEKNGYPKNHVKPGGRLKILMRQYHNLYGDISAGSGLNAFSRDPEHAYYFINEFQDRLLFGLDYCSVKNDMKHIDWLKSAKTGGHITEEVYEKIMWKNINKALSLDLE